MNLKDRFPQWNKRYFLTTLLPVLLVIAITVAAVLWLNGKPTETTVDTTGISFEKATVTRVLENNLTKDPQTGFLTGTQKIEIRIRTGEWKGTTQTISNYANYSYNVVCEEGTDLIVSVSTYEDEQTISVYTYDRSMALYFTIGLFCLLLCVIGGWKGVKSLLGLAFTFVCIIFVFIPLLYQGTSPVLASILLAVAATFVTMMLIDGWNAKTVSAILGTILCVSIAGLLSTLLGGFAQVNSYTMSGTDEMISLVRKADVQLNGLLFASILISSLGAIMDVCMSVATSLNELHVHNPQLSRMALFRSGINIGRDMMGTMSNTLILAFAGSSLASFLLLKGYGVSFHQLFSSPEIAHEIIQGMTGSMGVFLAVPIVALVASQLLVLKGNHPMGRLLGKVNSDGAKQKKPSEEKKK